MERYNEAYEIDVGRADCGAGSFEVYEGKESRVDVVGR